MRTEKARSIALALATGGAILTTGFALSLLLFVYQARAHDAIPTAAQPLGWAYGYECCSALDCSQSAPADVSEIAAGYYIRRTGEIIPYLDYRIKRSRDEYYHRCTHAANLDDPKSICLYVPDRGF